jgi:hypothetical protein
MSQFLLLVIGVMLVLVVCMLMVCVMWVKALLRSKVNAAHQDILQQIAMLNEGLEGLRKYLYEIDPQFDDERHAFGMMEHYDNPSVHAAYEALLVSKETVGKRLLATKFVSRKQPKKG